MNRMLRWASVLATLVLLAVACAGPGATPTKVPTGTPAATPTTAATTGAPSASAEPTATSATTPSGAASPSPSPTPTAPPGAVAGTLTIWADTVRAPILTTVGQAFEDSEAGVPVQVYEIGFGDIRDRLVQQGPAGEGPDIIIGAHDWLGQLVAAGVLAELPADLNGKAASFREVGLSAFSYDEKLYGMPYVSEAIALYYNKDLVPTPPTTWEELKTTAKALQDDTSLDVEQGLCLHRSDPYHTYPLLTGFGGYIFGQNADGSYNPEDVGLDSPGGLAYANELDQLVKDGLLRDNIDFAACETMFVGGQTAFWITGPWELKKFTDEGVNFGVAPIPTMVDTPRPFVGVQGFMISEDAPNKLLAEVFLTDFIATDETMRALWEADPRLPVWNTLADSMTDENIIAFTTSAENGDPMPQIPKMSDVFTAWANAINFVFAQSLDAEQAFMDAAVEIRGLIGQ
jgi:maltose-binding protein MalE